MNFAQFTDWRAQSLIDRPELADCGETNVYRALNYLRPARQRMTTQRPMAQCPTTLGPAAPIYRCDLARAWLRRYDFPEQWSRRALVCRGVRHALSLLLAAEPLKCYTWWMPRDTYPVYFDLAWAAAIEPLGYSTLPALLLPAAGAGQRGEVILLSNPLKPLGRFISGAECDTLLEWLAASSSRYAVLDCAYDLEAPLHSTTRRLWDSGRTIVLHTITKNWLSPKTFGIALVPDDFPSVESAFRADSPSADQLSWAHECFAIHGATPQQVALDLDRRRSALFAAIPADVRDRLLLSEAEIASGCYLFPVRIGADELLRDHRLLAIPASAFGGPANLSVLSSLADRFRDAL